MATPRCPAHGKELQPMDYFPVAGLDGLPGDTIRVACPVEGCFHQAQAAKELYREWEKQVGTEDLKLLDLARLRMSAALEEVQKQPGATPDRLLSYMAKCSAFLLSGGFMGYARKHGEDRAHGWLTDVLLEFQRAVKNYIGVDVVVQVTRKRE